MMKLAICDDNGTELRRAASIIERYAADCAHDVDITLFDDVEECIEKATDFDVVFMDIEFDNGPQGIEAAARINKIAPECQVVYLTNYLHYSLDVYSTEHAWYVLKSQLESRLPEIDEKLSNIGAARHAKIVVETTNSGDVVSINSGDIRYLERWNRTRHIYLCNGTKEQTREKLPDVLAKLPDNLFARCHNSYAVNLACVKRIHSAELNCDNGALIPISRRYAKQFRLKYMHWAETWTV